MRSKLDKIPKPDVELPKVDRKAARPTVERVKNAKSASIVNRSIEFDNVVLMNMGEGMYTVDTNGLVTSMNQTAEILFGWSFAELEGRLMHNATHYKHRDGSPFPAEDCVGYGVLKTGTSVKDHDDVFIKKDGTFFDVIYSSSLLRENGEVKGLVVVFRDVSERNRTLEALRQSEERFSQFMKFLPGLAWIKDAEGRYVFVNDAAERAFQRPKTELYGRSDREIFPSETAAKITENDRLAIENSTGVRLSDTFVNESGELRHSIVSKFPIIDANGAASMIGGVAIDITEQMRAEDRLRVLAGISDLIRTARDPSELMFKISESLGDHLNVRRCLFNEIDLENDRKIVHRDYCRGAESVAGVHKISDYGLGTSDEAERGKTVVNRDSLTDPRTASCYDRTYRPNGERSYVVVPLMREKKWVASLLVSDDVPRNWTDEEISLLETVADWTWVSAEKMRVDASLRQYISLIDLSYEPILVWTEDNTIISWNRGCEELYGFTKSEAIGQKSHDLLKTVHPFEPELLWAILKSDGIWTGELRQFTKDGCEVIVESRHQLTDSNGTLLVLETDRNITERKLAEEQSARLAAIVESSIDAIVSKDLEGTIRTWNRGAEDLFGYSAEEVIGLPITILIPADRQNEEPVILDRIRRGEKVDHFETVRRRKDGSLMDVSLTVSPIIDANGRIIGASKIARDITDEKAAEKRLRESESRFLLAQEAGTVGVWDWDIITNRTYWSETMWRIYERGRNGINPDEEFWLSCLHEADRVRARNSMHEVLASKEVRHSDVFRLAKPDGSVRWVESIATIQRNRDGVPIRMYGVDIDITEKKLTEERIRLSQDRLRLITDSVPALISYVDRDLRYRFANEKYAEWFGKPIETIIGITMKELLGSKVFHTLKPSLDRVLAGEASTVETMIRYPSAGDRFVQFSNIPDFSDGGIVRGFYVLVSDLTDRKSAEDLLKASEARVRILIESFTDHAIFSMDVDGRVESWSPGAENTFGYKESEILGRSYEILFVPEDVALAQADKEMRTARLKGRASGERWHLRKDGSRFYASGEMTPLYIGKTLTGYAKIARDLTEKLMIERKLQQSNDELEIRVAERTKELIAANARLRRQMDERAVAEAASKKLMKRLLTVQEDERGRIARDIHDQLGQRLTALRLKIASLNDICSEDPIMCDRINRLQEIAVHLDQEVSFIAWELRPSVLDDVGFTKALGDYVGEWSRHSDIFAEFGAMGLKDVELGADIENNLYRIIQEALNNAAKHANANKINVLLKKRDGEILLIIEDNGDGFDPRKFKEGREPGKGFGLHGMRERASIISGTLEIESSRNHGTSIYVKIPLS